jgi:hypothetical protein
MFLAQVETGDQQGPGLDGHLNRDGCALPALLGQGVIATWAGSRTGERRKEKASLPSMTVPVRRAK